MNSFLSLQTTCVLLLWHFFVWLTRLMRNVRHDCLLNPLICGPDPINHDTASSNKFPPLYQVYLAVTMRWGVCWLLFCLPTVSTVLRIVPLAAFAELDELSKICQQEVAWRVHISTFLPCWIKPIGSDNVRPANTDLFLNSVLNNTICQETGTYKGGDPA